MGRETDRGVWGKERLKRKAGPGLEGPRTLCMKFKLHPGHDGELLEFFFKAGTWCHQNTCLRFRLATLATCVRHDGGANFLPLGHGSLLFFFLPSSSPSLLPPTPFLSSANIY